MKVNIGMQLLLGGNSDYKDTKASINFIEINGELAFVKFVSYLNFSRVFS